MCQSLYKLVGLCLIITNLVYADNYLLHKDHRLLQENNSIDTVQSLDVLTTTKTLSSSIAQQLMKNKTFTDMNKTVAVTSFVDLNTLKETYGLGNFLSESLLHELQIFGINVIDFKANNAISVCKTGDYVITRDITKLTKELPIDYVVIGTFSPYTQGLVLNVRMIESNSQKVVSTAQEFIPNSLLKEVVYDKK